jgi:hypothetical protein
VKYCFFTNTQKLKVASINEGFSIMEFKDKKKKGIIFHFDSKEWLQVHPNEEFEIVEVKLNG